MEPSAQFIVKDKMRKLLLKGLAHDYKRVLRSLMVRIKIIEDNPKYLIDQDIHVFTRLIKTNITSVQRQLDLISNSIDSRPEMPSASIISMFSADLTAQMDAAISNIKIITDRIVRAEPEYDGSRSMHDLFNRARRQIISLLRLPFNEKPPELRAISLHEEVRRIIDDLYDLMERYSIDKKRNIEISLNSVIQTDQLLFTIIISNLISNSIVHASGKPDYLLSISEDGSEVAPETRRTLLRIVVADNGVGVPEADHGRIFKLFERGANTKDDDGGSGVGLPFAKVAAEMLGGTLRLESSSSGARFVLAIPS